KPNPSIWMRAKTTYINPTTSATFSGSASRPIRLTPPLRRAADRAKRPSTASKNILAITTPPPTRHPIAAARETKHAITPALASTSTTLVIWIDRSVGIDVLGTGEAISGVVILDWSNWMNSQALSEFVPG